VALNHERRLRGESFENRYDIVVQTKSGERREAEITVATLPGDDEPGVLIILADIHERKQVDRELAHSREMFSHVFQSNPTAVAISRVSDGRYLDVNPSHCRLFGWNREEAVGRSSVELGIWQSQTHARSGRRSCAKPANSAIGPPKCAIATASRSAWPSRPRYSQSRTSRWCFPLPAITPICGRPRPACAGARSVSAECSRPARWPP